MNEDDAKFVAEFAQALHDLADGLHNHGRRSQSKGRYSWCFSPKSSDAIVCIDSETGIIEEIEAPAAIVDVVRRACLKKLT